MISRFNKFYNSIINEGAEINETKKKSTAKTEKPVELTNLMDEPKEEKTPENDNGVKSLQKDFLNKFIRYNELQILLRDLPEIAGSFKAVQGFDETLIRDTIEKLMDERQKEMDTLTKELTDLREKITKEAEVANYKKSVIDIFNNQSTKTGDESPYGYIAKTADNGDAFNNGETIAAQDGVPTVCVGVPEPIDEPAEDPNNLMQPEELPDESDTKEKVVDDLAQAIEKDADAVELPKIPKQTGKITKKQLKSLEKTNLNKTPILIDSKKSKKSKK